ncbi:ATP-dependent RNA helicase DDX42 [Thelohanellus kitauei]|uniref:RNA helicase n=1 Tax=Thelohanellus kitauei TaxID=669202 RepID=A0A0C2N0W6_THEKT|nr:ATP-dependent RNA helicase DDX42 [Thelohanellus kitauei]
MEKGQQSSSEDELDRFMKMINDKVANKEPERPEKRHENIRDDIENMDDQETFYKYLEEHPVDTSAAIEEYDSEGELINVIKPKIMPLEPVDHSKIEYKTFEKKFFKPHGDIVNMSQDLIDKIRYEMSISIQGANVAPVVSFAYFNFDEILMESIRNHGYTTPTAIQAQGLPVVLSGHDMIGIAQTGSGKTATYLIPMLVHVGSQPKLGKDDGPIALIVAPTRELCQQIEKETGRLRGSRKFSVSMHI